MPNPPSKDFVTTTLNGALSSSSSTGTIGTGLGLSATDGLLHLDYDSIVAVGSDNGPETIGYATYNSTTGALTGVTRGLYGTQGAGGAGTGVAHINGATVSAGPSVGYLSNIGDGWNTCNETWTYLSATTITVPTDATTKYDPGDKIRLKQGGSYKYFYIVSLTATVLTITGGSSYTLTNATITDNYYSKVASPLAFPQWFSYSAFTVTSTTMTMGTVSGQAGRFKIEGRRCYFYFTVNQAKTGSGTVFGIFVGTLPVPIASTQLVAPTGVGAIDNLYPTACIPTQSTQNIEIRENISNMTADGVQRGLLGSCEYEI